MSTATKSYLPVIWTLDRQVEQGRVRAWRG